MSNCVVLRLLETPTLWYTVASLIIARVGMLTGLHLIWQTVVGLIGLHYFHGNGADAVPRQMH